jgi:uncharacterized protein YciI
VGQKHSAFVCKMQEECHIVGYGPFKARTGGIHACKKQFSTYKAGMQVPPCLYPEIPP